MNSDGSGRSGQDNPGESQTDDPQQMRGYFVHIPAERAESRLDLRLIWRNLVRYKLMIGVVFLLPVVLSALAVTVIRPVYQSNVLLAPAVTDEGQGGISALTSQFRGLASITGVSMSSGNSKDQAIAVLKSRSFTEDFINSENLLPILFQKKWDSDANRWKTDNEDDIPTMADAFKLFNEDIRKVNDDASTNLITLRIEWSDRKLAAKWANLLVERLNETLRARDIAEAQRSIEFLNRELEKNSVVELRQGIFGLLEQQIEKIMIANVRQGYAFKVLDPAVVADADQYIHPRKLVTVIATAILGFFFALVAVMIRISLANSAES